VPGCLSARVPNTKEYLSAWVPECESPKHQGVPECESPKHPSTQAPKHPNTQAPKHPNTQTPKHPNTQTPNHTQKKMKYRYRVLAWLFGLSAIVYLDRVCIALVSGSIKKELGLSTTDWGWVLSAFALSYALFELPTGIVGDRIGPRRILVRVVVWWSVFTALTGLAWNWMSLVAIRFLFGAGEAGAYPNASIVVSRWFPAQETGLAQAFIWAAGRLGGVIAPILVIGLAQAYGWRVAFGVLGALGIVWALGWRWWFRDMPEDMPGIPAAELAHIEENRRFKVHSHHIDWSLLLHNRNMWALIGMFHLYMWGAFFFTGWLSTYLEEGRHFSTAERQMFVMLPFFLGALGCFTGGLASDMLSKRYGLRFGRRIVGITGMGLSGLVILLAASTGDNATAAWLLAFGMGFKDLTLPVAFAVCVDIGGSRAGMVSGAMNMIGQLGAVFLGVLFGYIVQGSGGNYDAPLYLIGVLLLVGCGLWFAIDPEQKVV
jgi:MFS transporter, ACS family, glucarate transporter